MKKKLNLDVKGLQQKLLGRLQKFSRYFGVIFAVLVLLTYAFLVWRINTLSQQKPSDDDVAEKLQSIKLPKIDQSVIDKIQQLQDNSVEVQTLFQQARDNPFQE